MKGFVYLLFLTFILAAGPVYAYLDPGTGSYIFQIVVASLLAGSYFFKDKLKAVFNLIGKMLKKLIPKGHGKS